MTKYENRYCRKCMSKTEHTVIQQTDIMRRKGKSLYKCKNCKTEIWKKHLRPSAESSY